MRPFITLVAVALLVVGCGIGDAQTHVRSAVDAKNPELSQCYASALGRDASASGRMNAWIYVRSADGQIERVEFEESEINDPTLQSCISEALTQVRLSEAPAANLKIQYTFELTPTG